ncbi:uncharacterized protein M421DRAFT_114124 [Didymella exigua CBS 183.55]|uniref:Uncharacterized protein n=1 Tax=Didymella exigua CBS 183.55 TaxID=1150837 RepID=A0A6A5S6N2_9PLEO|nr:uncharacterized protein M421DRAFT_114124 [Didymella exigua CBS 183.55]KAF1934146.1 hypothetical protein M421DRAFT_114124 [Didymella exigua CBS 183.55]
MKIASRSWRGSEALLRFSKTLCSEAQRPNAASGHCAILTCWPYKRISAIIHPTSSCVGPIPHSASRAVSNCQWYAPQCPEHEMVRTRWNSRLDSRDLRPSWCLQLLRAPGTARRRVSTIVKPARSPRVCRWWAPLIKTVLTYHQRYAADCRYV